MKKLFAMKILNILAVVLAATFFAACTKDEYVKIDTLGADGNEFFSNQKVKLWMSVKSSNLSEVDYQWGCEDGTLTQPQGLDEMTWKAPSEPGTYRVFCTVKIGNESETRYRDMLVSSFFFEKFEKTSYSFKGQSSTTLTKKTETLNGITNGYLEAVVKSTTSTNRYIYYNFSDTGLHTPFSCMSTVGWISDFPADTIKVGTSKYANKLYYEIVLNRDPNKEDAAYIDNVRFEWFPVGNTKGLPKDPAGQQYNGCLLFEQNLSGAKKWFQVSVNANELNFAKAENKKVALNISPDYIATVYVNGTKILETDAIKNWRIENNSKDDMYVGEWRLVFPNGNGGNKPPKIYFDNAYAKADGSLLTGS